MPDWKVKKLKDSTFMPPLSPSSNAYGYPLLIKHLLTRSNIASVCQKIVSGTEMRLSYADLGKRVRQLANALKASGSRWLVGWQKKMTFF